MTIETPQQAAWIFGPLFLLAFTAGGLRVLGLRQADERRRRAYQIAWILLLLVGAPLWLFVAAALGLV